jgi:hypothetical protein
MLLYLVSNIICVYVTFYFILHNILSGRLFLIWNIILGQYFNIKFLPMLLYIFQMRWKKFNIKIYPWIALHIITFQPEKYYRGINVRKYRRGKNEQYRETGIFFMLLFAFCGYFWSCIYVTISLYSSSIIQYRLLPINQIFNIFKLTWLLIMWGDILFLSCRLSVCPSHSLSAQLLWNYWTEFHETW